MLAEKHVSSLGALQVRVTTNHPRVGVSMACPPLIVLCVYVCDCVQSALGTIGRECATSRDEFSAAAQAMRNLQRTLVTVEAQEVSQ